MSHVSTVEMNSLVEMVQLNTQNQCFDEEVAAYLDNYNDHVLLFKHVY